MYLFRVQVQRIRANVLVMWPCHRPVHSLDLLEIVPLFQFAENTEIKKMRAVIDAFFPIRERDFQGEVIFGRNRLDSRIHGSPQGVDRKGWLAADRKLPIGEQLIAVYLDPGQDQLHY